MIIFEKMKEVTGVILLLDSTHILNLLLAILKEFRAMVESEDPAKEDFLKGGIPAHTNESIALQQRNEQPSATCGTCSRGMSRLRRSVKCLRVLCAPPKWTRTTSTVFYKQSETRLR